MQYRKPNFLIIGAMKAGTTTLYEDLRATPEFYLPPEKEPNDLAYWDGENEEVLTQYLLKFEGARSELWVGDASTAYAKLPRYEGIAERARNGLGPDLRIVYMVRHPVDRAISHYKHNVLRGVETRAPEEAMTPLSGYIAYGRPDYQLAPWRDRFRAENILLLSFEDYVEQRVETLNTLRAFFDLPRTSSNLAPIRNASAGKRIIPQGSALRSFITSKFYLYRIKPLLPLGLRDRLKALVARQSEVNVRLDRSLIDHIVTASLSEADRLCLRSISARFEF